MDGEWWRLISCTFLHGGMSHIFFNGYVLYALGSGLERLIGTSRFIVLYGVSGLAGSLLSLQFVQTQSVGASGAIWGLLGAYSILVLRSPSPMPLSLRRQSRRAVWMTLGINILVSFLPFVDAAAHFGGGIAGATLMLLPAYRRGLPEFDGDQLRHGATPTEPPMKLAAALLTAAYLMGLALGLTHDQPWRPSADGKSRTGQVQVQRLSSQPAAGAGVIEIIDKHSARASQ